MPQITFTQGHPPLHVRHGINLMSALQGARLPVGASCSGEGVCGKCYVQIIKGSENLSPITKLEENLLSKYEMPPDTRMSCLTRVKGDITIAAPYW